MFSRRPTARANRGRIGGAQLRAIWPPTQVSGNVGWWDLLEPTSLNIFGATALGIDNIVSGVEWTDATSPPGYNATGLNGLPCLTGNGTSNRYVSSEAAVVAAFSGASKALTFVCVAQPTTGSGAAATMIGAGAAALVANSSWRLGLTAADVPVMSKRGTVTTVSATGAMAAGASPAVYSFRTNGTTADIWRGLVRETTGAAFADSGAPAPDRVGLLCYPVNTLASFFNGKWGCGLLWNRALSDAELSGIVLGLKQRWSI
jgi:hypothetical protein